MLINIFKKRDVVRRYNPNDAIYHCTVQKTGSTWINNVFQDKRVYKYTGLKVVPYIDLPKSIQDAAVPVVPLKSIAVRFYLDYSTYLRIEKPPSYKTFYITRDPRDIVVSWYYSMKFSHTPLSELAEGREKLNNMSEAEGFIYSIDAISKIGIFKALRSWIDVEKDDPRIRLFRYEDLVEDEFETFRAIFQHCDIDMPERVCNSLIKDHSFERKANRKKGNEDVHSHMRKGISGDWKNHFSPEMVETFKKETGDLVVRMGYEKDEDWHL
jgi:hypothetical protein